MLSDLRAEQDQKRKALQLTKVPKARTKEVGTQAAERIPPLKLIDVSTQTDSHNNDSVSELKEQVQQLMKVVKELSTLKGDLIAGVKATAPGSPRNHDFSDDESFGSIVSDALMTTLGTEEESSNEVIRESPSRHLPQPLPALQLLPSTTFQAHQRVPSYPATFQSQSAYVSQAAPRAPLRSIEQNFQELTLSFSGPTEEQRRKVEGVVCLGKEMTMCALACVDILFSEEELANGNTGGVRGFQQLDFNKIHLIMSTLQRKFDSPVFKEQWEQVKTKINTKCRGKRRTLVHRLKKENVI